MKTKVVHRKQVYHSQIRKRSKHNNIGHKTATISNTNISCIEVRDLKKTLILNTVKIPAHGKCDYHNGKNN